MTNAWLNPCLRVFGMMCCYIILIYCLWCDMIALEWCWIVLPAVSRSRLWRCHGDGCLLAECWRQRLTKRRSSERAERQHDQRVPPGDATVCGGGRRRGHPADVGVRGRRGAGAVAVPVPVSVAAGTAARTTRRALHNRLHADGHVAAT